MDLEHSQYHNDNNNPFIYYSFITLPKSFIILFCLIIIIFSIYMKREIVSYCSDIYK